MVCLPEADINLTSLSVTCPLWPSESCIPAQTPFEEKPGLLRASRSGINTTVLFLSLVVLLYDSGYSSYCGFDGQASVPSSCMRGVLRIKGSLLGLWNED